MRPGMGLQCNRAKLFRWVGTQAADVPRVRRKLDFDASAGVSSPTRRTPCRFDVASVSGDDDALRVKWIGTAFDASEN